MFSKRNIRVLKYVVFLLLVLAFLNIKREFFSTTIMSNERDVSEASVHIQLSKQVVSCRLVDAYTKFDLVAGELYEFRLLARRDTITASGNKPLASYNFGYYRLEQTEIADLFKFLYESHVVLIDILFLRDKALVLYILTYSIKFFFYLKVFFLY